MKWFNYPEPDRPPEEPSSNSWQPKNPLMWRRQNCSFGQASFQPPNFGSSIFEPPMSQNMAPNLPVFRSNEPFTNTMPVHTNNDWQRFHEGNTPYWSPAMVGPTGTPKRMLKIENPIQEDSSYNNNKMEYNWTQQQMCNRQMFVQKPNIKPNFHSSAYQNYRQNLDSLNTNRAVFNNKQPLQGNNNEQPLKWRQSESQPGNRSFDYMNNTVDDFKGLLWISPQKQQNMNFNEKHRLDYNYFGMPKIDSHKVQNVFKTSNFELSKNFSTPQKPNAFQNYRSNSTSAGNLSFRKEPRLVLNHTPSRVQQCPSFSSFTSINSATPSTSFTDKVSPQKRLSQNRNSELILKRAKADEAPDLREYLIAKRRKLNGNDTNVSANTVIGKFKEI